MRGRGVESVEDTFLFDRKSYQIKNAPQYKKVHVECAKHILNKKGEMPDGKRENGSVAGTDT